MLKSLEISGFKSFAKKTELKFNSKITAIVGPNGSGKSNIAEAFRFALGEQSIKSMRGKRGEDLIWNGSTEVAKSNRGNVKLFFDNKNQIFNDKNIDIDNEKNLDLSFDEIKIERAVNRDGSNEYYLNNSAVRLKDIHEILSRVHIGTSSHHIISQGEADRILRANLKERKEIIEESLGLKTYQYKILDSNKKISKTEENISQIESLRREIAPHIKFLKKQVEKIEKAEEIRQKLIVIYREYLKRESFYLAKEKEDINKIKIPLEERIKTLEMNMRLAIEILEKSKGKDLKSTELINIEAKIQEARLEKDILSREIGKIEGEINVNNRNLEKIKSDQKSEETKMIPLKSVEDLEKEISLIKEIDTILSKIRDFIFKQKNHFDQKMIEDLLLINKNLINKREILEKNILEKNDYLTKLNTEYLDIKNSIEKEKDSGREAEKNIFKIESEQTKTQSEYTSILEKENYLNHLENDFQKEIEEATAILGTYIIGFENEILLNINESRELQIERKRELEKMKIRLEEIGGSGGTEIMKEYRDSLERDEFLSKELEDLKNSKDSLGQLIFELKIRLETDFKNGLEKINKNFEEFFKLMFGGGEAKLILIKNKKSNINLENLEDIMEEKNIEEEAGIDIEISLPRKRIKNLDMLSGGERALTSIALLFAISQVNPPPFVILDETDAALDEANSKKYGDMIEQLSKLSQLILITHNRETMSRAGIIYGITMGKDGVSRLLSINFEEAVSVAK